MKILIVHPHPGDLACEGSGTIALHTARGDEVYCLLLSDGERHHNDFIHQELAKPAAQQDPKIIGTNVEEIKAYKRAEAHRIAQYLGIKKLYALGWPDVQWTCTDERIEQIAAVIREVRPDVLLGPMPWGEYQSQLTDVHATGGHMTRMAARYCSDSLPQIDGHEPHHTKLIFWLARVIRVAPRARYLRRVKDDGECLVAARTPSRGCATVRLGISICPCAPKTWRRNTRPTISPVMPL